MTVYNGMEWNEHRVLSDAGLVILPTLLVIAIYYLEVKENFKYRQMQFTLTLRQLMGIAFIERMSIHFLGNIYHGMHKGYREKLQNYSSADHGWLLGSSPRYIQSMKPGK